jgi:hypothetical protein
VAFLYVYALTDTALGTWTDGDRILESIPVDRFFAVSERRDSPPSLDEAELRRQHSIVSRIAEYAPALLPARFGSLVNAEEMAAIVRQRQAVIHQALDRVRGMAQMTIRFTVPRTTTLDGPTLSGRAYLERRMAEASAPIPAVVAAALDAVRRFVVDERRKSGSDGTSALYHLVRRTDVNNYRDALGDASGMVVTGPFPPFAFTPDLWS